MKPSELPGARRLYRLTNRALAQIRELWQYAGEDMSFLRTLSSRLKLRPLESCTSTCHSRPSGSSSSFAQNISPASPISSTALLPISFGLSSLCASSSPLVTNLIPKALPSALVASVAVTSSSHFGDRPVGLLSHADGSGLLPEARPKLTALSWEEIRLALMLDIEDESGERE